MIRAWHNEPSLKVVALQRIREHQRLDQIVQGSYWQDGRGCNLGCLTHDNDDAHGAAERLFGIEQRVGYWLEVVFERLPKELCAQWVIDSAAAIAVGADLSKCHNHLAVWNLSGESGLLTISDLNRDAIAQMLELHRQALVGTVSDEQWSAAWSAARSAARSSAAASAESAAESSARSSAAASAESAWSAARSAAESAAESAWSAARSAAESAAWKKIASKSLEIFRAAPVEQSPETIPAAIRSELCCKRLWCPDDALVKV